MTLEGFRFLEKALEKSPDLVRSFASSAVAASAYAIAERARSLVPVATGELKSSIDYTRTRTSLTGSVGLSGKDTYYWRFVEFGTRNMAARPFFRPAAESERNVFVQRMRDIGPRLERDLSVSRFG